LRRPRGCNELAVLLFSCPFQRIRFTGFGASGSRLLSSRYAVPISIAGNIEQMDAHLYCSLLSREKAVHLEFQIVQRLRRLRVLAHQHYQIVLSAPIVIGNYLCVHKTAIAIDSCRGRRK
jgi:hypothetical protein